MLVIYSGEIAASSPTIQVEPSRFEILLKPRGKDIQSIKIKNHDHNPLKLMIYTQDWSLNEMGRILLLEPGAEKNTAADWLRFNPKAVNIQAGGIQYIRFSVNVPPGIKSGEYRTSLILTTANKYQMNKDFSYQPKIMIPIYINIPEIKRKGEIREVKVKVNDRGNYFLNGEIFSLGNAHLRIDSEYFLFDEKNNTVDANQLPKKVILPGSKEIFAIDLGKLERGTYTCKIVWDYIPALYMGGGNDEYSEDKDYLIKQIKFDVK